MSEADGSRESSTLDPEPRVRVALPLVRPVVIWGILAVTIAAYAVETWSGGSQNTETLIALGAKVNYLIVQGQYWRLITPMFLHIGLMHVLINVYSATVLGLEVEALYGHSRMLAIYLLSGIAGNVASFAFSPAVSAGASTAIFGLVGTQLAFFYRHRKLFGAVGRRRLVNTAGIVLANLLFGLAVSGVDNFGHMGGFVGGLALGWILSPTYEAEAGQDGRIRIRDRNSLLQEAPGLLLFSLLLLVAIGGATLRAKNDPRIKLQEGVAVLDSGNYAASLPLLESAARRLPADGQAQFLLAANYFNLERYSEAAGAFEAALELEPDFANARYYLALSYLRLDRRSEAAAQLDRFLALQPVGDQADLARQLVTGLR